MVDGEEIVVVSASEGVNTRGKTRTTSKKKDQAGANAAIRLLETCQKLVQSQQSKGKTKIISIDRSLFEELIDRVKQCEKITEDSLSFNRSSSQSAIGSTNLRITTPLVQQEESINAGTKEKFTRYMDVKEATNWITRALQKHETTKETEIAGVGVTKFGYVICFKNEKLKEIASKHNE
ncbi:uncharacterized protein PV09_09541 [Verruconis gallopava]|uniref:Uncharacterized protein n=1 Tax=Verruconis gallopava TaxID=253628 RepID=A0A0D1X983_9PEZI|nr:uncharacterized protein PV09_09541 [Verruconis gallopava]KIV98685.1 hypothetical protein PV09_09541 [Verruconis gallopava]